MDLNNVISEVENLENEMVQTMMELIKIPAIAPESGGEGESKKADKLLHILKEIIIDKIEHYNAEDDRVPTQVRPNIIAYYYGEEKGEKLWIVTHMDVVPPGEESLWTITKPYEPIVKEGRIYGRGSEDNGQSLISAIFAIKALKNLEIKLEFVVWELRRKYLEQCLEFVSMILKDYRADMRDVEVLGQ